MIKLNTFILAACISISLTFAQTRDKVNQSIEWSSINSNIRIQNKMTVYVEGNFRFARDLEPMQHQFRTGLDIALSKKFSFMPVGYVYTWNYKYGKQPTAYINNEHRLYQQLTFKNSWNRFYFQQRVRMEERFIQAHGKDVVNDAYADKRYRLRVRSMINIPLNSKKIEVGTVFASILDEVFFSWGNAVTYNSKPDQNRLYGGLGYQASKSFSFQAGFIYQYMIKQNGLQQENNYGCNVTISYNLDLMRVAN
jgi:hypothetical protein